MILVEVARANVVVTTEKRAWPGGFSSAVAELMLEAGLSPRFNRLGIPDVFPDQYGSQASLLKHHDITAARLTETMATLFHR